MSESKAKVLVIVEGPNDAAFIQLLLDVLNLINTKVEPVNPFEILNLHEEKSRGKTALKNRLERLKGDLLLKYTSLEQLSIILDADNFQDGGGVSGSLDIVNDAFHSGLGYHPGFTEEGDTKQISIKISSDLISLNASCFFIKIANGEGNMDVLLKAIATKASEVPYCQCLEEVLLPCVQQKGGTIKDFEKQWNNHYIRHFATKEQLKMADGLLPKIILEKGHEIFDLDHILLQDLKAYLKKISA